MAVFYKWIKGCEIGASFDAKQWSYLKWGEGFEKDENGNNKLSLSVMPTLGLSYGKKDNQQDADLGYILTSNIPPVNIANKWAFDTGFSIGEVSFEAAESGDVTVSSSKLIFKNEADYGYAENKTSVLTIPRYENRYNSGVRVNGGFYILYNEQGTEKVSLYAQGKVLLGGDNRSGGIPESWTVQIPCWNDSESTVVNGNLEIKGTTTGKDGSCSAVYFNATSDMRAKENITPATYNALELINKLPIYTFNYKNSKDTVTGILAQDLLKMQPNNLDLVSNIGATGDNGDYMSIKNDKLTFVLMKAIQEQQEQINILKSEIEKLISNK